MKTIKSFTVGMANSPDIMAARAVADALGCQHHEYLFTAEEAFGILPKVVYHLETYEPELIRSSIPNFFLAKLASEHTKVVLTGEGADELFAGYLYFKDAPSREMLHDETLRIWGHLNNVNLQRSDRMSMAHSLEARVPFLDVDMLKEAYENIDPSVKMHAHDEGRIEKWALRSLFEDAGIPEDVVWRTKAMQCEGVGVDWVSTLQTMCENAVSDEAFAAAPTRFPTNPPQSKEEYYYRDLFEQHFPGMDKFVHVWEGGCRAGGAPWENSQYTRAGLKDTSQLTHGLQEGVESKVEGIKASARGARTAEPKMALVDEEATLLQHTTISDASMAHALSSGGDTRVLVDSESGRNSYHCPPMPLGGSIVRGSCTGSPPTARGVAAATAQMQRLAELKAASAGQSDEAAANSYASAFGEEVEQVRARLTEAFQLPEGSALVLCASGTCAEYVPLAIARELFPEAQINSVLAADGETGSGGPNACSGKYFNTLAPFAPFEEREIGASLGMGSVQLMQLPARSPDGEPADAAAALADCLAGSADAGSDSAEPPVWIVRQVLGSKTGLHTSSLTNAVPEGTSNDRLFEVVDLCQARCPLGDIAAQLAEERCVLLTGSKFFQGGVFSAAVAVPPSLVARLNANAPSAPRLAAGLSDFLSAHEVPRELAHWRQQLSSHTNEGLLLRWHTALPLVEGVAALAPSRRTALEALWTQRVRELIAETTTLDVFYAELGIVSISCTLPDGKLGSKAELQKVHKWLAMDLSSAPNAAACPSAATPVFIGQPVAIKDGHAVVRLALGAELLLDLDAEEAVAAEDVAAVAKLGWVVANYAALDAWSSPKAATVGVANKSPAPVMQLLAEPDIVEATELHDEHEEGRVLPTTPRGVAVEHAKRALLNADAVCFDVDGTVISEEAINLLGDQLGVGEQVRALTLAAQEGALPFDEALSQRLRLMRPSLSDIEMLLERSPTQELLTPGVLDLMTLLRARGTDVYLVSGGFIQLITPIAHAVGVPLDNVYANSLAFNSDGSFMDQGIDQLLASQPTARKGGKAKVVSQLKQKFGYETVVMIGDGATDMEARDGDGTADAFVGFGGVRIRSVVEANACWFVTHFNEMIAHLEADAQQQPHTSARERHPVVPAR